MKDDSISRHAARSFICDIYRKIGLTDDQMMTLCKGIMELPPAQSDLFPDATKKMPPVQGKYEYHYDHTDCIWYRPEARNRCPCTCAQYRDGWNDAMNYIFRDGEGYRPYRRDKPYEK